jgi:hypothetical protein
MAAAPAGTAQLQTDRHRQPDNRSRHEALRAATVAAVLSGKGTTSTELRQRLARSQPPAELQALVEKIRDRAYQVTDEDLSVLRIATAKTNSSSW